MIKKSNILASFLLAAMLTAGCVTNTTRGDEPIRPVVDNVLAAVSIDDYSMTITANENFEYSLSRTSDPFKVFIELKGVDQGTFKERIISNKEGISEVVFMNKTLPAKTTLAEITLSAPLDVTHSIKGNVLTVSVKRLENTLSNPQQAQAIPDGDGFVMPEAVFAENAPTHITDARSIVGLTFKKEPDAIKIVIQGDGAMKPNFSTLRETLFLDIPGVRLSAVMPTDVIFPLKELRWEEKPTGVRIVMTLDKDVSSKVLAAGDMVVVSLTTTAMVEAASKKLADTEAKRKAALAEGIKSDSKAPSPKLPSATSTAMSKGTIGDKPAEAKAQQDDGQNGFLCNKPVPC
ncbi:MAG: AMIN domain-containing protein, partial [Nitrospirae bacterium]|nr:AMIN domain-containing protein [Nitrospirota bacterium]